MPKVYHNQPMHEFLQNVRDNAVAAGAGWQLIDKIDELRDAGSLDEHEYALEVARNEGEAKAEADCQSEIDELRTENDNLAARIAELEAELDQVQSEAADRID